MLKIKITREMLKYAKEESEKMGRLNRSFTKGDGNIAGFLGEAIVSDFLNCRIKHTYDYDLIYEGLKIDVKTKRCKSEPKSFYECSIAEYTITKQNPDIYVFTRILNGNRYGWILGWVSKEEYLGIAKYNKKGDKDPSNNFTFVESCYNVPIHNLKKIEDLKKSC